MIVDLSASGETGDATVQPSSTDAGDPPVFILTAARSGSTLLRFILDSHPMLACPPETGPGGVCAGLGRLWRILCEEANIPTEQDPGSADRLSPGALAMIRGVIEFLYQEYPNRRNKQRWCDKSLDNFIYAPLLAAVFPDAKFLCLYRHCMDVIVSGLEASTWGLQGFGFDNFAYQFPGNNAAAIGAYWLNCTQSILEFEENNSGRCMRIRYEDMVSDPEKVASSLFGFLEIPDIPGIARSCLETAHDMTGPGDQKIWFTNRISTTSIGRGVRVPLRAFPPPMLNDINKTLERLGYRIVDDEWSQATRQLDPRADASSDLSAAEQVPSAECDEIMALITARANGAAASRRAELSARWPDVAAQPIQLVVEGAGRATRTLTFPELASATDDEAERVDACPSIAGDAATWRALLMGHANMAVELQARRIRCSGVRMPSLICPPEAMAVAYLLGLSTARQPATPAPG